MAGPDVVGVAEKVRPATVLVQNLAIASRDPSQSIGPGLVPRGVGTGFIYDPAGFIVTNHHVVEGAQRLRVVLPPPDNRQFDARLLGSDAQTDLAVMQVQGDGLPIVPLGSSDSLKVGDWVVAIGNALGLPGGPTVTAGVVSALGREVQEPPGPSGAPGPTLYSLIQTDAAINPGNSGGPLVNLRSEVVGVNTIGAAEANTIGFAISIDSAKPIIDQLRQNGRVARGYLGISVVSVNEALRGALGLQQATGVVIRDVAPGGPAAAAGLRPGDVIIRIGETPVEDRADLEYALSTQYKPGETVPVTVVRDGREQTVQVRLGDRPTAPQR
ncbi:MAG TPA: trypsin-like peptidase domain-containing protein [Chloroflexota bacterium]|nr:trypsin-like peptidase domain-containing protein [Chloroflexota bacterium]